MTKLSLLIIAIIFSSVFAFAQVEIVEPTFSVDIVRDVSFANINDKMHYDVTARLIVAPSYNKFVKGIKVIITHISTGEIVFKKRFSKSHLYVFSDETIKIGKVNAHTQLKLYESNGYWCMDLK